MIIHPNMVMCCFLPLSLWVVVKVKQSFPLVIKLTSAIDFTILSAMIMRWNTGGGSLKRLQIVPSFLSFLTSTTKDLRPNSEWLTWKKKIMLWINQWQPQSIEDTVHAPTLAHLISLFALYISFLHPDLPSYSNNHIGMNFWAYVWWQHRGNAS